MNWLREPDTEPIPGYRLLEPIGTGGFGEVWKCVAPGGIHKAIKFVYGNLNSLDGDDVRAQQEMKALERVKEVRHPFVLSIEQIREVSGELVIVMELADRNLHDCLIEYQSKGQPGIPRDRLISFLDDAAVGLDHLIEKHNLQHLDVKPRNLFVVADRVKVADFGLVKQLERSSSSGLMGGVTPIYAAPETFSNKISKHSDQYSLAVVYVELISGKRVFSGKNIRQLALQHMTETPDLSMLPVPDRDVVGRALAKNPEDRFASCTAFIRALAGLRYESPSIAVLDLGPESRARRTVHEVDLTPASSGSKNGVATLSPPAVGQRARVVARPAAAPEIDEDHFLAVTAPQKEVGVLRPTVLIGIGSFGRRSLQELKCRLIDRLGDITQVPIIRFLYVDCDPEAVTKAINAPPDVALTPDDVFPVPLQPVTGYRRRHLEHILDWLPREKLYAIPRSLHAGGSRALGRLAFSDNYLRFITRLRRELQIATHPESMKQSSDQTGLTARDNVPQVYVFASGTGGAGGMLIDLGFGIRRVLGRLNAADAPVSAFVFASAPHDPATSDSERANLYAALTELNHYSDSDVSFAAHYGGPEGSRVEGQGLPFSATYLLPMPDRNAQAFRDCISHLAGYVSHDLATPLGAALEQVRMHAPELGRTLFREFGTYGVWYPRGLLLRAAAQRICTRIVREWSAETAARWSIKIDLLITQIMGDVRLKPDAVQQQIEQEMPRFPEGSTSDQIERWLHGLEGQIDATARRAEAPAWSRNAWDQAREFIGVRSTSDLDTIRRGRMSKTLDDAVRRVAEKWGNEIVELTRPLEEDPGTRIAAVEHGLKRIAQLCDEAAETVDRKVQQFDVRVRQVRTDVQAALDACQAGSGSFSFFGGRSGRSMRHFLEQLRTYARARLQEDLLDATGRFYRTLRGKIEDRLRGLAVCRSRLVHIVQELESPVFNLPAQTDTPVALSEEALQQTLHPTNTLQVVLPSGETHIDRSAAQMVKSIKPEDIFRLEHALQKLVLEPRGGLTSVCEMNADLLRFLVSPMIEQTTAFLGDLLPVSDVTDAEFSTSQAKRVDELSRVRDLYERAAPPNESATGERTYVIVPDTDSGKAFARLVKEALPSALLIPVQGPATDLMFCRERDCLKPAELTSLLEACQAAYYAALASPHTSPHARFDVMEWIPLNE